MTEQQLAEQKRLGEILQLARLQLNEEYMKKHSAAHTGWLASARSAWTTNGTLLPFVSSFIYPTEEEVVARGVQIYNSLTPKIAAQEPVIEQALPAAEPVVEEVKEEPITELLQAGGDFVIADVTEEELHVDEIAELVTDVEVKEVAKKPVEEITVTDSLLESKFKSLFTKWGGRGNY